MIPEAGKNAMKRNINPNAYSGFSLNLKKEKNVRIREMHIPMRTYGLKIVSAYDIASDLSMKSVFGKK